MDDGRSSSSSGRVRVRADRLLSQCSSNRRVPAPPEAQSASVGSVPTKQDSVCFKGLVKARKNCETITKACSDKFKII